MRSKKAKALFLFVAIVVLLRQSLLWIDDNSELRREQRTVLENSGVEPAAMFYTEIRATRRAESAIRNQLIVEHAEKCRGKALGAYIQ